MLIQEKRVQSGDGFEARKHGFIYTAPEAWDAVYGVWGTKGPIAVWGQQPLKVQQSWSSLFTDQGSMASLGVQGSVFLPALSPIK